MNTTLILVAYAFPPENVSGAARPSRFYRHLPECGVSPLVITASSQERDRPGIEFVRDVARDFPRQNWSWHLERIVRKLLLPGELGLMWSRRAAVQGIKRITSRGHTVVLSTSPPLSAHLAALRIKKKLRIPWIADFRDPMYPSGQPIVSRLNVYPMLEAFLFSRADAVIANTDAMCEEWRVRYPAHRGKLHVIWNGFDPDDVIMALPIPQRGFKHMAHLGELYAGRHPGPILDSIQRLLSRGALSPGTLRLSLIGTSSDDSIPNVAVLRRLVAAGIVEYVPSQIPRDEARLVARQADALVLLQPQSDVQVPAKLFEYIRIGRPVLAFIRRGSPAELILGRSGIPHRSIYPEDSPEEVDAKMLDFLSIRNDPVSPSEWFVEQFNARRQAQTLSKIINQLTGRPNQT